jgi:tripeptide aminopeptidase
MAQLMTLARVLAENPAISHGDLLLVFRPDEEIGRMAVIEGLAAQLAARGVKFGYTADGLDPFEVNVENFNASRARVAFQGQPVTFHAQVARRIDFLLHGVKSHGATAKAEGYRNATRLVCEILRKVPRDAVFPLHFQSDVTSEVNATLSLLLHGASDAALDLAEQSVCTALETAFSPLQKRGASWEITARLAVDPNSPYTDEIAQTLQFVDAFLHSQHAPTPLLSEDSEGFQGYTNPYFIDHKSPHATLDLRIRDFSPEQCKVREEHVRSVVSQHPHVTVEIAQQYINMGPALAPFPELLTWAQEAARSIEQTAPRLPIRGGTGVDPFLVHGIPVANLGTGYFAPESEKELTSRQSLARHILWHVQLVHHIATHFASQS